MDRAVAACRCRPLGEDGSRRAALRLLDAMRDALRAYALRLATRIAWAPELTTRTTVPYAPVTVLRAPR